jgi:hypothetical protein
MTEDAYDDHNNIYLYARFTMAYGMAIHIHTQLTRGVPYYVLYVYVHMYVLMYLCLNEK